MERSGCEPHLPGSIASISTNSLLTSQEIHPTLTKRKRFGNKRIYGNLQHFKCLQALMQMKSTIPFNQEIVTKYFQEQNENV